jgi:hypothetical protein
MYRYCIDFSSYMYKYCKYYIYMYRYSTSGKIYMFCTCTPLVVTPFSLLYF